MEPVVGIEPTTYGLRNRNCISSLNVRKPAKSLQILVEMPFLGLGLRRVKTHRNALRLLHRVALGAAWSGSWAASVSLTGLVRSKLWPERSMPPVKPARWVSLSPSGPRIETNRTASRAGGNQATAAHTRSDLRRSLRRRTKPGIASAGSRECSARPSSPVRPAATLCMPLAPRGQPELSDGWPAGLRPRVE